MEHDIPFGVDEVGDVAAEVGRAVQVRAPEPQPLRQWTVILHDSPVHTVQYVLEMLPKCVGMTADQAKMVAARMVAGEDAVPVFTAHKELAELKASIIEAYGPDQRAVAYGKDCPGSMQTSLREV